ncbi:TonB-dependent receptor [delta proteobacterium NaphS2]|nr:TonB-dependent receptor [delta proteobacterium NaphS2]
MTGIGHMSGVHFRLPLLVAVAALISAGIFALVPFLLRQTSYQPHLHRASCALLIPVKAVETPYPIQPENDFEPPPREPEPPEPELENEPPDIPEMAPPKIPPPEMERPEVTHEPLEMTPLTPQTPEPPQISMPAINVVSLNALPIQSSPMNLKVNLQAAKVPVPNAVAPPPGPPKAMSTKATFGMDEVDQKPAGIGVLKPPYPFSARRKGIEGYVTVRFLVDKTGKAREVKILDAKPPGIFDRAVHKTVPRWRFKPGKKGGKSVDTWVKITIRFELGDDA